MPDFSLSLLFLGSYRIRPCCVSALLLLLFASGCVYDIDAKNFHFIKTNAAVFEIIKSHKGGMSQRMKNA